MLPQKSVLLLLLRAETRLLITASFHPAQAYSLPAPSNLSYSLSSCVLRMVMLCCIHHHSITEVSLPLTGSRKKVKKQFYQIFTCHLCSYIKNGITLQSFILGIHHYKTTEIPDSAAGCYDLEPTKTNEHFQEPNTC